MSHSEYSNGQISQSDDVFGKEDFKKLTEEFDVILLVGVSDPCYLMRMLDQISMSFASNTSIITLSNNPKTTATLPNLADSFLVSSNVDWIHATINF